VVQTLGAARKSPQSLGFQESSSNRMSWHRTCTSKRAFGNHLTGEHIVIHASLAQETATPVDVSLVELILVLSEITEDVDEIFSTVDHMLETGSVRLSHRSIDHLIQFMPEA
jgi:hypothetical protein